MTAVNDKLSERNAELALQVAALGNSAAVRAATDEVDRLRGLLREARTTIADEAEFNDWTGPTGLLAALDAARGAQEGKR